VFIVYVGFLALKVFYVGMKNFRHFLYLLFTCGGVLIDGSFSYFLAYAVIYAETLLCIS
jgi:hypothetical protein